MGLFNMKWLVPIFDWQGHGHPRLTEVREQKPACLVQFHRKAAVAWIDPVHTSKLDHGAVEEGDLVCELRFLDII